LSTDREATLKNAEKLLRQGQLAEARPLLSRAVRSSVKKRDAAIALAWSLCDSDPDATALCVDVVVEALLEAGDFGKAAALLEELSARIPGHVATLLRLVEVCVDGGLETLMFEAQARLADAYLAADCAAEARVIAEDLVARDPSNPEHAARLRRALDALGIENTGRIKSTAEHTTAAKKAAPPPPAALEIDLTGLLGDLRKAAPPTPAPEERPRPTQNLEDVFAGMRAEVSGAEADTSDEHLALARSYLEMGMPAEAVAPLEMAARSPRHRFTASVMLGELLRDEGNLPEAIEWFERAAEAPPSGRNEGLALLYDLGDVLETVGETARALAVFLELDADAPGFRDVRARVTRLSRLETEG
jgi:tetratricopeptide (TPR) repeat protein